MEKIDKRKKQPVPEVAEFENPAVTIVKTLTIKEKAARAMARKRFEIPDIRADFFLRNAGYYIMAGGDSAPQFFINKFQAHIEEDFLIRQFMKRTGTMPCQYPLMDFKRAGNYMRYEQVKSVLICQLEGELALYYFEKVKGVGFIITAFFKLCKHDIEKVLYDACREAGMTKDEAIEQVIGSWLNSYYAKKAQFYKEVARAFFNCQVTFEPYFLQHGFCYSVKDWNTDVFYKEINRSTLVGF